MKMLSKFRILLFWCSIWLPGISISQDTLKIFRFPRVDLIEVVINAKVVPTAGKSRYHYEITSLETSKQNIWVFDVPFDIQPHQVKSPKGWNADAGGGVQRITWGSNDSVYNIHPSQTLSGFSYESDGIPRITTMYLRGWAEPPELTFEPDSVVGEDVLEASKKVLTIAAARPPEPFIPLAFLDTLLSYTRQSAALGWLAPPGQGRDRDEDSDEDEKPEHGLVHNIEQRLKKAKRELQRQDSVKARRELEKLVKKVERVWKRSQDEEKRGRKQRMTSEAYALLKYNTEYLIDRLPKKKGEKDDDKEDR